MRFYCGNDFDKLSNHRFILITLVRGRKQILLNDFLVFCFPLLDSSENAMSPAVSPAINATPQFIFPLSPPNSQPGSPSPFFSATGSTSAFALPDVVTTSIRTNAANEFTAQMQSGFANVPVAVSHAVRQSEISSASNVLRQKLGKRRRSKFSRKKKLTEGTTAGDVGCAIYERQTKIPRTTTSVATMTAYSSCSCGIAAFDSNLNRLSKYYKDISCYCSCGCNQHATEPSSDHKIPICMHVSEELRKIVECFKNSRNVSVSLFILF